MVQTWADVVLGLGSEKFAVTRMTWAHKRIVSFICPYSLAIVTALLWHGGISAAPIQLGNE